jgi:hypothetical protein
MASANFDIRKQETGEFLVQIETTLGTEKISLNLSEAEELSEGALGDDETTARAVVAFLLKNQEPADLPGQVDLRDIDGAYEDALDGIQEILRQ